MDTIYSLLVELSLLAFLGGLYYLYQRKRILTHAQEEKDYLREEILFFFNQELEHSNDPKYRKCLETLQAQDYGNLTFDNFEELPVEIQELINRLNSL